MHRLKGRIITGLGEGSRYIYLYRDRFLKILGINPYPGTLNIELVEPRFFNIEDYKYIEVDPPSQAYGKVLAVKARIKNIPVYIIKPLKTRHALNIIEVISEHNLREALGVKTGDVVEIYIED